MTKDQLVEHFRVEQARIVRERERVESSKVRIDRLYTLTLAQMSEVMVLFEEALAEVIPGWILVYNKTEDDSTRIVLQRNRGPRTWLLVGEVTKDFAAQTIYFRDAFAEVKRPISPLAEDTSEISVEACLLRGLNLALRAVF
jgi:hypothetical protein